MNTCGRILKNWILQFLCVPFYILWFVPVLLILKKEKTKEKFLAYKKTFPEEEEEYVEYEQLIEKVMHIIENMPQQTATVFKKCFIERKKYQEAGDELGISINTVRWHITKAISILRGQMSDVEMILLYAFFLKK